MIRTCTHISLPVSLCQVYNWERIREHLLTIKENILNICKKVGKKDGTNPLSWEASFDDGILEKPNHAILSGIWLLKQKLSDVTEGQEEIEIEKELRTVSATAISLHNKKQGNLQIEFNNFPVAFLLLFCDNLCEWGRVKFKEDGNLEGSEDSPKLRNIYPDTNNNNRIVGELEYLGLGSDIDLARKKDKIRNNIRNHVRPFTDVFRGSFEIKYYFSGEELKPSVRFD